MQRENYNIRLFHPRSPSVDDFASQYEEMRCRAVFSNNGPIATTFETSLNNMFLGLNCAITNSGTSALEAIFRSYNLKGNVVTTPFSYIATAHAAKACQLDVKYANIENETLNIEATSVENLIDANTSAIIAVHTYGHPCEIQKLEALASKYGIRLIFDAAQALGTQINGLDLLYFGDASAVSFHATKVLSSVEGGAVFSKDKELIEKVRAYRQFGIDDTGSVKSFGLNAKMSELHACVGLDNLRFLQSDIVKRNQVLQWYAQYLTDINHISLQPNTNAGEYYNGAYCAVEIQHLQDPLRFVEYLRKNGIQSRRYFHPLLSTLSEYCDSETSEAPVPEKAANMFCLPMHPFLQVTDIKYIAEIIYDFFDNNSRS